MNVRLESFLEKHKVISPAQIGFTKGKRTSDHMFILKSLIDKHTQKGSKPLYTCFVDFRRAFDTVNHKALFYKLCKIGVGQYFYRVIKSMYTNTVLCVKSQNQLTTDFGSYVGVRQGDNLNLPFLRFLLMILLLY